ncbi:S41 family peptidase [Polaribacter glomeratus]|uniref:Tricorn protease homolog n=1 Tax=Polaribacter glomeratus TaxID=102 RepID=A0A2S7WI81_9FLAO|nr:S41 family peptidase [Polaribacter glomeratus]PQJ77300.1 Tricorn protease like protein [Polaribacter glomeratus]TXD65884.1 Tricorn protease like protein [Polaribacter glomeratus]
MKKILTLFFAFISFYSYSQINAKLLRYVDVSQTQICFVYGGDIWVLDKNGGVATQLTNSPGEESYPKFSPNGEEIAFTASYRGNPDVYVMNIKGGVPKRITYGSHSDRMVEWHPNGEKILFASRRETGIPSGRVNQLFLISKNGGMPEKLAIPYGEIASFSADGKQLAYITKITETYPFKRYRGGLTSDVILFNLENNTAKNITNNTANDGKPAWAGDKIYFLSDRADDMRLNVWSYDTKNEAIKQVTQFKDFDITYLSAGPSNLVFEVGGTLHLMDLATEQSKEIKVSVVSDLTLEMSKRVNVQRNINNATVSPGAKRIVFEARGELFNVPVKDGFVHNITASSGAFDRSPSWSPNGDHLAYWSDASGENEIYIQAMREEKAPRKITSRNKGYGYALYWSPDSNKLAFIDEKNDISIVDVASGKIEIADNYMWNYGHGSRNGYAINWSHDSNYLTYAIGMENSNEAIFIYDINSKESKQVTSGFYNDSDPVFSKDGKYLFFLTNRNFDAAYSALGDGTWIYPNATQLAAISLSDASPYILQAKNDALEAEKKEELSENKEKSKKAKPESQPIKIDWNGLENRLVILPIKPGNLGELMAFDGKVTYMRYPNTGSDGGDPALLFYDLKDREEKSIISKVRNVIQTADGASLLVQVGAQFAIVKPEPDQKIKDAIPTDGLVMELHPKEEWRQIFKDTWRRYRDFFYDEEMQQVDWQAMRTRYGALIEDARSRWDISYLQSNMLAELSAGHTYTRGGDNETVDYVSTGYLGIDWGMDSKGYRIKRIVKPAAWDAENRSPFDRPGVDVSEGDYIHSVNGVALPLDKEPFAAFEGLNGKTVVLKISKTGKLSDAKDIVVTCLTENEEENIRYLNWIETNRLLVEKLSDGKLGYVYMTDTSPRGQLDLVKMYYGQLDKEGFIIDERFNGGGQLADRFLELLTRPVIYNLYWRHGKTTTQPAKTNTGPMGMLINGWAGSGGDGLPWAFRELDAGPIVGERTIGILVGPATGHQLIDGGGITVPGARLYYNSGKWFDEGVGVKPDFTVWDDPNLLLKGRDPQMEKVVLEVLKLVKTNPKTSTPTPAKEDRTAEGLRKN